MINIAIVGYGHIGKRHAEHIINHSETNLVAVCDLLETAKDEQIKNLNIPFYQVFEDILEMDNIDVISICVPNYLHACYAIAALEKGKHVIAEKPMALSVQESKAMIEAAEKNNKIIFAVKQNRYNPPIQSVKEILGLNKLGKINFVQVNCFWNRGDHYYQKGSWRGTLDKDGGCLFTQFSHFIDILYYLNGKIKSATGFIENYLHKHNTEFEDTGSFVLLAENGSIVNFNFTTTAFERNMEGSITLFGDKGTVKIGGQYLNTIEYQNIEHTYLPNINISAKENDYGLYKGSMSNHDKVIDNVVNVLKHNFPIMTSAQEGLEVVSIIEMMYAAARKSQ